jgi:hypothetical protein
VRSRLVTSAVLLLALSGCSSAPDPGPVFDDEGGPEVSCMAHQPQEPGARYTEPAMRDTAEVLAVMRYYTAHGAKPFCDGAPATEADRAWGRFYLEMGGTPEKVSTVLG